MEDDKSKETKMLKVLAETHQQIKVQAALKNISIYEYVQYLADLDKGV